VNAVNSIHRSKSNGPVSSGSVSYASRAVARGAEAKASLSEAKASFTEARASLGEGNMSKGKKMSKGKSIVIAAAAAVATVFGLGSARNAQAAPFTLTDRNSSIAIDPTSPNGISNWTVDGVNQLAQEWFWYRVGPSGTQSRVNSLVPPGAPTVNTIDISGSGNPSYAQVTYPSSHGFQLSLTFSLSGGQTGSRSSDLGEIIKITNTSATALDYHFYQYSDFNLGGSASGENVNITGGNTATVSNPSNFMVSQTVVTPRPAAYEANSFPNLVNELDSTSGLELSDAASVSNTNGEWAFQWDRVLAPGASFLITVDKNVHGLSVPEPTSLALFGLGGLFLTRPRRRDEDPDPRTAQVAEA
jgi:hypothetical protein